jgi:hypothetical protein
MKYQTNMKVAVVIILVLFICPVMSLGAGRKISERGNKHNFSYENISSNYRALPTGDNPSYPRSNQICVFCHTPHRSSGDGPLWNRKGSSVAFFKHYSSSTLIIDDPTVRGTSEYGQPNGSTRLCLSCHDGVTALGTLFTTPFSTTEVQMHFLDVKQGISGPNVHLPYQTFSSHHPVSFKYDANVRSILTSAPYNKSYWYSPANGVKLDRYERMQCTTCHDPHQDKSDVPDPTTPFWTSKTYVEVCQSCHNMTTFP